MTLALDDSVRTLIREGASIHWLHPRSKRPIEENWPSAPTYDLETLIRKHGTDYNVGLRPGAHSKTAYGYLHVLDLDIRGAEWEAEAWANLPPGARSLPSVISGSGGCSRHLYFFAEKPLKSQKVAVSEGFSEVFDPEKGRNVRKRHWEIDLFGTGKQVAIPPSIHPDTGQPYRWERPIDWLMCSLGIIPTISLDAEVMNQDDDDEDDLFALTRQEPMGLDRDRITQVIADLPEEWVEDRVTWLQVGAALSHEFRGSAEGFAIWCEWSQQSPKFKLRDQRVVWKSFKGAKNPIRMATLIAAGGRNRLAKETDWMDVLLGDGTAVPRPSETAPAETTAIDWKSLIQYTEEGQVKSTLPNLNVLLSNDPRTRSVIGYNSFRQQIVLIREPALVGRKSASDKPIRQLDGPVWRASDTVNGEIWTDDHDNSLRLMLESQKGQGGYDIRVSDRDLRAAVNTVALKNSFHPVRDYLDRLVWDGKPRAASLFVSYLGSPDTEYHRMAARLTLVGAATRVFEPGHKFDFMPILEGLQGKRKSTFVSVLGRGWTIELSCDFSDAPEMTAAIQGAWLVEIPELQSFSRGEVTDIKAAVSRTKDTVRLPYDRRPRDYYRQCIFIGTTNDSEYLRDETGGRRFWPIVCEVDAIDLDRLETEIDQIWAEAVAIYRAMRAIQPNGLLPLFLNNEEAAAEAVLIQKSRTVESAETQLSGQIAAWLDQPIGTESGYDDLDPEAPKSYRMETCPQEIWDKMFRKEGIIPHRESIMIGKAMHMMKGWVRVENEFSVVAKKYGARRIYKRT